MRCLIVHVAPVKLEPILFKYWSKGKVATFVDFTNLQCVKVHEFFHFSQKRIIVHTKIWKKSIKKKKKMMKKSMWNVFLFKWNKNRISEAKRSSWTRFFFLMDVCNADFANLFFLLKWFEWVFLRINKSVSKFSAWSVIELIHIEKEKKKERLRSFMFKCMVLTPASNALFT